MPNVSNIPKTGAPNIPKAAPNIPPIIGCTINGHPIEVSPGTTIIEAYKKLETDIAHYCWHPGLSVAGVCRLCMVEIEGVPRLQIACNTEIKDGMVITNQSQQVKETVRWGMDFHLINHPLDCPICDQAGECGLQQQYMKFGQYDPEMAESKIKKRKVVDLGSKIVLDTERCILCSRCVRFTEEVSKTHELGIFNRGDRSEIGTFKDNPLENDYALNTVDICPVGALTSKDFRFRQRVWYLKDAETICPGCSTGCHIRTFFNKEGFFRVQPVFNQDVNGHWMCDKGREVYKFVNKDHRLTKAQWSPHGDSQWTELSSGMAAKESGVWLRKLLEEEGSDALALVLTGQYTSEEYKDILDFFTGELRSQNIYHWVNNPEQWDEFDGLLLRGDKNPNTKGLQSALEERGLSGDKSHMSKLSPKLENKKIKGLIVAGPENPSVFPDLNDRIKEFSKANSMIWLSATPLPSTNKPSTDAVTDIDVVSRAEISRDKVSQVLSKTWQIPMKTFVEKEGTFINFEGRHQKIKAITTVVAGALTLSEASQLLGGRELSFPPYLQTTPISNEFVHRKDTI